MFREHSNREKQQQRFGFRKYKAGVSSVLLAVAFLGAVLPSFVAPMATIVYAGTRIPGSKAELNDAAAKSVDLANIANFDFTSLLIVESGYHAKLNYVKVGTTYGTPENNFSEITGAKATGTAMVNFVIIDDNTGQPYTKQDGQVDFVSPSILITNTPAPKPATPQPEVKENTVPEKTPVAGQPVSVVPKEPNTTIVTPNPVNGLTVDSDGHLTGTPTVDDWQPGEESRKITIPVTVTGQDKTPVTVEVPVTITRVTPTTEGITVPQGTPITEKDVTDKVTVPAGGKITTIGEIPSTDTAGDKPAVEVIITYPNGDTETVEVPVKVTPKVPTTEGITVPKHSKITEDDIKNKVTIPEGSGGTIKTVGEIPSTSTEGEKTPVTVVVEYPDGSTTEVKVPVTVTSLDSSTAGDITVPQHTPITEDDVKNKVTIPEGSGGVITKVTNIPTTTEAGKKPEVEVIVTYPNGDTEVVKVPITVTPVTPTTEGITVPQGTPITEKDVTDKVTVPAGGKITTVGNIPSTDTAGDKPAVEVIITYPNGDTETVEVPVKVTPKVPTTEGITVPKHSKITEDDIKNKVTIPEGSGGTIKTVGEIPSTSTEGEKTPVTVVVEYPDGSTTEVKVPVTVTSLDSSTAGDITVPQHTPITEDDVKNKVTIPEGSGGVITKVTNIPTTTEAGKKPEVEVIVTYPNGDTEVVKVPITVTPVTPTTEGITVPQGTPITEKDVTDKVTVPAGGKITTVGNIPSTDTAGDKPAVEVIITYPNGDTETVEVPVKVTPKAPTTEGITVPKHSKITEDDIKNKVTIPEGSGGTIKTVGEIPSTSTEGEKTPVTVVVEYPDGSTTEVKVPVTVTSLDSSTAGDITVPQHTPITEDDVKNKVTIPEGSGGVITKVTNIPTTTEAGKKPEAEVIVTYPNGDTEVVKVPITVTPVTPTTEGITVPQGTPITEKDVTDKVTVPAGGKITTVGNIPSTDTAGDKPAVEVIITYPNGDTETVEVPVKVTPKAPTTEGITVPKHSKITEDDIKNKVTIPEGSGGTIKTVGEIPSTSTEGEKTPVTVVVEYPDGSTTEVKVPVTVTSLDSSTAGDITVPQHTPITEDDVKNKVTIPEGSGGVITKVTNIPTTTEAGKKPEVEVIVTYPNGDTEVVKVPITVTPVTPTTEGITVPQGTPITEKDVTDKVTVPAGGKITTVGNIPSTDTAGDKPAVEVIITYPNGDTETVEVPVKVTPKAPTTEGITVPKHSKITEDDIKNKVTIPEGSGGTIKTVGEIPSTSTEGEKTPVTVVVEYPDGSTTEVKVPVTVTSLDSSTAGDITVPQHTPITEDDVKNKVTIPEGSGGVITKVTNIPTTTEAGKKPEAEVIVTYPNGDTEVVKVPITVTPVTPTTEGITVPQGTPITEKDVTDKVTVPAGGKITTVGNIPSTDTAGDKPAVEVIITYPNGDTETVEVPVKVTPKAPTTEGITVPKHSKITEDDIKNKVTIPEGSGGTIKTVGEIPSTSTEGEKTPVTVVVEYPDGSTTEVKVPVTVTSLDSSTAGDITVPQHTPITEDDVKNKVTIPEGSGGVITKVTNIPTTTEAGKKPEAEVIVTYPNGDTEVVKVPITVTPVTPTTEGITVPQGTPITEKDVTDKVTVPAGGKITTVGNIPSTDTAGDKPAVEVIITYPNGDTETVEVPVKVTPKAPTTEGITVPKHSKITEDDIKNKVTIPEGSGGTIKTVGEIPSTSTEGEKTPVTVVVEYPDGSTTEVKVPVTVTSLDSSTAGDITVPQHTPITEDDVKNKVTIPEGSGGVITKVTNIPTTTEAGKKPEAEVIVTYPNGDTEVVKVPITVTPVTPTTEGITVPQGTPITEKDVTDKVTVPAGGKITTVGNIPSTDTAGDKPAVEVIITYPNGDTEVVKVPVTVTTKVPMKSNTDKVTPDAGMTTPKTADKKVLPKTGENSSMATVYGVILAILSMFGLAVSRRKEEK